eukprot:GHVN01057498.1.p2 GENE.GHVN01057498.1~~GHVN01057498.1.p2  ORF type:complete len:646 (-),score=78.88 GHVN01057498.1:2481-4418(-)
MATVEPPAGMFFIIDSEEEPISGLEEDDVYDIHDVGDGAAPFRCNPQSHRCNPQSKPSSTKVFQPSRNNAAHVLAKFERPARVVDTHDGSKMSHAVRNAIESTQRTADAPRRRGLTRDTRATVEQVLDEKTLLMIHKMMKREVFTEIFGCVSTGKEANVYLALRHEEALAIKVYKTSVLVFRERSRYVDGDYRFRQGYCKSSNPRKMVRQWAEKEFRNLNRLVTGGLPCPYPIELKDWVLAMTFVGEGCDAAPRLKDLRASPLRWRNLFIQTVAIMKVMFQQCRLVHGDLSEYNLLYHQGRVVVIDVSQSVGHDHSQSLDFLKRDCHNVKRFFSRDCKLELSVKPRTRPINMEGKPMVMDGETADEEDLFGIRQRESDRSSEGEINHDVEDDDNGDDMEGQGERLWCGMTVVQLFEFIVQPKEPMGYHPHSYVSLINEGDNENKSTQTPIPLAVWDTGNKPVASNPQTDAKQAAVIEARKDFIATCFSIQQWISSPEFKKWGEMAHDTSPTSQQAGDEVFMNSWTPSHLNQMCDIPAIEREMDRKERGEQVIHERLLATATNPHECEETSTESDTSDMITDTIYPSSSDEDKLDNEGSHSKDDRFGGLTRKEWKHKVREENRERRKTKVKKHIKKKYRSKAANRG